MKTSFYSVVSSVTGKCLFAGNKKADYVDFIKKNGELKVVSKSTVYEDQLLVLVK